MISGKGLQQLHVGTAGSKVIFGATALTNGMGVRRVPGRFQP